MINTIKTCCSPEINNYSYIHQLTVLWTIIKRAFPSSLRLADKNSVRIYAMRAKRSAHLILQDLIIPIPFG
jgi:hypothetical protein